LIPSAGEHSDFEIRSLQGQQRFDSRLDQATPDNSNDEKAARFAIELPDVAIAE
jgi:hypothetical protein